jgi:hypothetical protein
MDYDGAAKDLKDIKVTMDRTAAQVSKDPGWFFLIQGGVWLIGFLATQFAPSVAGLLWPALTAAGIAAVIGVSLALYGKKGRQKHPGLASRIVAISIGILVFDLLLVFSFGLTDPGDFTLLLVLSMAFCYFVIGLITRQIMSVVGAFIALSVFAARMLFPAFLYLSIAMLGGGAFLAFGAFVLLRKEKTDA